MSGNNFENELQQKMGELKIIPSVEVWKGVSSRINKKDRKDKFILLLYFILGGIVFSGAWYGYNQFPENNKPEKALTDKVGIRKKIIIPYSNTSGIINKEALASRLSGKKVISVKKKLDTQIFSPLKQELITKTNSKRHNPAILENFPKINSKWLLGDISQDEIVLNSTPGKTLNEIPAEIDSILVKDTIPIEGGKNDSVKLNQTNNDSVKLGNKQQDVPKTKKHKWEYGLTLMGGLTQIGNNILSLDKSVSSPATYTTGIQGQNSGPQFMPLTNSTSFNVGIILKRQLSKRVNFHTGATINYYSTIRKPRRDSFQNRTNRFIFVDLPLSIEWRLNKNIRFPIFLEGGLNFSQLVYSNAVQYDQGQYIRNNSSFNKTQIGTNLTLSVELANTRRFKFIAGPKLQYNISKIAGTGEYAEKHIAFAGIQTRIIFHSGK